ncbi:MAG: hypothetical protein ACE15D_02200 [Candidatus Eisenbacteria bacterium]|nr:hypothetical protein [Candidatus Eisenbacteria bacterium]
MSSPTAVERRSDTSMPRPPGASSPSDSAYVVLTNGAGLLAVWLGHQVALRVESILAARVVTRSSRRSYALVPHLLLSTGTWT